MSLPKAIKLLVSKMKKDQDNDSAWHNDSNVPIYPIKYYIACKLYIVMYDNLNLTMQITNEDK